MKSEWTTQQLPKFLSLSVPAHYLNFSQGYPLYRNPWTAILGVSFSGELQEFLFFYFHSEFYAANASVSPIPCSCSARAVLLVLGARLLPAGGPTYLWAPSEDRLLSWPGWGHSGSVVIVTFVSIHCTKLHFLLLTEYCKYPSVSLELFINFALPNIWKHLISTEVIHVQCKLGRSRKR